MDPSKLAGMSWDAWTNYVQTQTQGEKPIDPSPKIESKVHKLRKEDSKIFGLCVDAEPLMFNVCEKCDITVKPQALLDHYATKHTVALAKLESCEKYSPDEIKRGDRSVDTPLVKLASGDPLVKNCDSNNSNDVDAVSENIEDKSQSMSSPVAAPERTGRKGTSRSPLGKVCPNRCHHKRKVPSVKNKLNGKKVLLSITDSLSQEEQKETTNGPNAKNGVNNLLHQLPGMSLNNGKEEQDAAVDTFTGSVPFITSYPRALSVSPMFSCHKAGGLLYPSRHMKDTRQNLLKLFNVNNPTNLFQKLLARRKTTNILDTKENMTVNHNNVIL